MAYIREIVDSQGIVTVDGEKVNNLVNHIINFFKEEKLTYGEAKCILKQIENELDDCSLVGSRTINKS